MQSFTVDNAVYQGHLVSKYCTNFMVYYLRIEFFHVECVNRQRPSAFHRVQKTNIWVHASTRFHVRLCHICVQILSAKNGNIYPVAERLSLLTVQKTLKPTFVYIQGLKWCPTMLISRSAAKQFMWTIILKHCCIIITHCWKGKMNSHNKLLKGWYWKTEAQSF